MKNNRKRIRRKNTGYKKLIIAIAIIFMVVFIFAKVIVPVTVTVSSYVYNVVKSFYLGTKEFYFTSDKLADNVKDAYFEANNWSGGSNYNLDITLYSKKNAIKKVDDGLVSGSPMDINYNISFDYSIYKAEKHGTTVTYDLTSPAESVTDINSDATLQAANDASKYINISLGAGEYFNGTLYASYHQASFSICIEPHTSGTTKFENDDYIYLKVYANATSPYTKQIVGEFIIKVGQEGLSYQIDDNKNDPYCNLILTNATDIYTVDTAFTAPDGTAVAAGTTLAYDTYRTYIDSDSSIKDKCHSMYIDLSFDPDKIRLDMTSTAYLNAEGKTNWILTTDTSGETYISGVRVKLDALQSETIKFYKTDISQDYSYPYGTNACQVTVVKHDSATEAFRTS